MQVLVDGILKAWTEQTEQGDVRPDEHYSHS